MKIGYDRENSEAYGKKYGAVILAAGLSSRMKAFKPLLPVAGRTAVEGLIESAKAAGIDDITVVSGHNREDLEQHIKAAGVKIVYNPEYKKGMLSSIKEGLNAASESGREGYLLMPVDCPLISVNVMRKLMNAGNDIRGKANSQSPFFVAAFEGKKGHPLLIPAHNIEEICRYDGEGGLAAVTDRHEVIRVETGEEGCVLDMDTPEGYEDIINFTAKGFAREKMELLTARKRIFLVRHGETRQHAEPVFIGQYDVPLSEKGRIQGVALADEIVSTIRGDIEAEAPGMDKFGREAMPAIERIYASDLVRAGETAGIICDKINAILPKPVKVKSLRGLREIDLGAWDGRKISEIREEYPAEYENRGTNMMSFKLRGSGAENFYDMQYRVIGAFRELLRNDDAKNIIIVAHSGVIRILENNIKGLRVDDDWEPIKKGDFRMFEPFPEQPSEKVHGNRPMNMNDMIMDSALDYYD